MGGWAAEVLKCPLLHLPVSALHPASSWGGCAECGAPKIAAPRPVSAHRQEAGGDAALPREAASLQVGLMFL